MDSTEKAQEAIKALNPLCTLRYSATHRNPYNLVYRLDPVRAFELQAGQADRRGERRRRRRRPTTPSCASSRSTTRRASRPSCASTCRRRTGRRRSRSRSRRAPTCSRSRTSAPATRNGFSVAEINAEPGSEFIRFSNGRTLRLGEEIGGMRDDVWRAQIKHTVKRHLEKELQVRGARHQGADPVLHRPRGQLPRLRRRRAAGARASSPRPSRRSWPRWPRTSATATLAWLQAADRAAAQRLLRAGQEGRAEGHARRHAGRRRGLQPHHEGQGAAARRWTSRCASSSATRRCARAGTTPTSSRSAR